MSSPSRKGNAGLRSTRGRRAPLQPGFRRPDVLRYLAGVTPLETLAAWLAEAEAAHLPEPSAMALATASPDGTPSVRYVLCRGIDARGVRFFTNYDSRKAHDLDATGRAAAVFYWAPLARQVRVEGRVVRATAEESDTYFHVPATRPPARGRGLPAEPPDRDLDELRARYADLESRLAGGSRPAPGRVGRLLAARRRRRAMARGRRPNARSYAVFAQRTAAVVRGATRTVICPRIFSFSAVDRR